MIAKQFPILSRAYLLTGIGVMLLAGIYYGVLIGERVVESRRRRRYEPD